MSMRQLKRSIAHANMKDAGIPHVNRKIFGGKSYFSMMWRRFVYRPGDKKALKRALASDEV